MNIIYLLSSVYLLILIIGFALAGYYLFTEKGITDVKEFSLVLFFAPFGFGNWKYNRMIRNNKIPAQSKIWHIYTDMIRINWFIIAVLLVYEVYAFYHIYQIIIHYNDFKDTTSATIGSTATDILYSSFGWMINWSIYIVLAFMAIIMLFSFLAFFIVFIILPKLLLKSK